MRTAAPCSITARRRSSALSTRPAANSTASSVNPSAEPSSYPQIPRTRPKKSLVAVGDSSGDGRQRREQTMNAAVQAVPALGPVAACKALGVSRASLHRLRNPPPALARADYASAPHMHIERVLRHVDAARIRQRHFRVALDAVNGAGSVMTVGFLRDTLGCDLHAISIDPTKPFPRIAEPRPDTLGDLSNLVRSMEM